MSEIIKALEWRYATKKFNPEKKISKDDLTKIKTAIQLAASSYGLQAYTVLDVADKATREKLKEASWGQNQITDAAHLFVFCGYKNVTPKTIDAFLAQKAKDTNQEPDTLQAFGDSVKGALHTKSADEIKVWTAKQTYIALGKALTICGELEIDSCPMEGFEPAKYNEILGLESKNLQANVVLTLGYRAKDDKYQHLNKSRKNLEELFQTI